MNQLKEQYASLEVTLKEQEKAIHLLKRNRERMKSDALFVELIAHENRRIRPGELVFFIHGPEEP